MEDAGLTLPELYINRELSLLEFNCRVLELAKDKKMPLLERLRFLCISSTNLDEFFEIRVAGLRQKIAAGTIKVSSDGYAPVTLLKQINEKQVNLINDQYRVLNDELVPELAKENIRFIRRSDWTAEQEQWLKTYFKEALLPILSPLGLDSAHPFPRILNKALGFIISLKGKDAFGRASRFAVVHAPRSLPRLIQLPPEIANDSPNNFVFLSSIIHAFVDQLFFGMKVTGCYQFRVTRNSELYVDEEEIDDLLRAMEGELSLRRHGDVVRLEVDEACPTEMSDYLLNNFSLDEDSLYRVNGPVNLNRLLAICDLPDRPDLRFPAFNPGIPKALSANPDLFTLLKRQDLLLHHPYESFLPFIDFLKRAALDPGVLAIKQTLYRTGPDSAVVSALVDAARKGKEVTVVIELRARFDEADNIELANRLQDAGAHVVYGVVGYKTHSKMALVIRREPEGLCYYTHLSTGNYHPKNACIYTDYGLFTANSEFGEDVHKVFLQLTSLGKSTQLNKLLQSPFTMHDAILAKIKHAAECASQGKTARIVAKMNSLVEVEVIRELYRASTAGVEIELIVRGMCQLRPGIKGVSENIRVRSILGRFLEHGRVFSFTYDDETEVYAASADWMERNFFQRVELAFPLLDKHIKARVINELNDYLQDDTQAWLLDSEGHYNKIQTNEAEPFSVQQKLLETFTLP